MVFTDRKFVVLMVTVGIGRLADPRAPARNRFPGRGAGAEPRLHRFSPREGRASAERGAEWLVNSGGAGAGRRARERQDPAPRPVKQRNSAIYGSPAVSTEKPTLGQASAWPLERTLTQASRSACELIEAEERRRRRARPRSGVWRGREAIMAAVSEVELASWLPNRERIRKLELGVEIVER